MHKLIYLLCALTALTCSIALLGAYARSRFRLLLWSGACFVGLTANNLLLIVDRLVFPSVDLSPWRLGVTLLAVLLLLYGLIIESTG
jgi:hypothetical protein